MIKVQIVKDGVKGADDGATVRSYPKDGGPEGDGVYLVSPALAEVLIEAGEATEIEVKKQSVTDKLKAAGKGKTKAKTEEPVEPVVPEPAAPAVIPEPVPEPTAPVVPSIGLPGLPKSSGK